MYNPNRDLIQELFMASLKAALKAGETIMDIYYSDNDQITVKSDHSIISLADQLAHKAIEDQLAFTRIPLISEEGRTIEYEERKSWELFWLVDPLDGTRQFIQKKKEFTVNIALLINSCPITGVIYAPATSELYFACKGQGAYKLHLDEHCTPMSTFAELLGKSLKLPLEYRRTPGQFVVLTSPYHVNVETKNYIDEKNLQYDKLEIMNVGSSLKMCLIASGVADAYPRHDATYEWDTAAAQVILEEAGCSIRSLETGHQLSYNKESLLNPCFICTAEPCHPIR